MSEKQAAGSNIRLPAHGQRIEWLDTAKGIAILAVIVGHAGLPVEERLVFPWHLMIFFLLSGYTLKVEPVGSAYLKKKFERLMLPYFTTCAAVALMDQVNRVILHQGENGSAVLVRDLVRTLFASGSIKTFGTLDVGTRIGAIWFLPAMFFSLLFSQLILGRLFRYRYFVACAGMAIAIITKNYIWLPFSIQSALCAVPFVILGHDLASRGTALSFRARYIPCALFLYAFGVYQGYSLFFVSASWKDPLLSTVCGLSACWLVCLLAKRFSKSRFLKWSGIHSMEILCVHLFALETMGAYFRYILKLLSVQKTDTDAYRRCVLCISLVFIYLAAWLFVNTKKAARARSAKQKTALSPEEAGRKLLAGVICVLILTAAGPLQPALQNVFSFVGILAAVFLYGYDFGIYDKKITVRESLEHFLCPYLLFAGTSLLLAAARGADMAHLQTRVSQMFWGQSLSGSADISVLVQAMAGTVLMEALLERYEKDFVRQILFAGGISAAGMLLGAHGILLPWGLDLAMYFLLPLAIGRMAGEHAALKKLGEMPWLYFLAAPVWAYAAGSTSADILQRSVQPYSVVLAGAFGGMLVIYWACRYLSVQLPDVALAEIYAAGRSMVGILLVSMLMHEGIMYLRPAMADSKGVFFAEAGMAVLLCLAWNRLRPILKNSGESFVSSGKSRKH